MSPRVSRSLLPTIEPILLTPRRDPFDDPTWLFEPKYDSYRGLLHVAPAEATFLSKHRITHGEVLVNADGHANFRLLMRGQGQLH
jgi:ATP-dependent DNA ligase